MNAMGDKALAKATMKKSSVPVVPGSDGVLEDIKQAKRIAEEIGFPVIVKATAGGGGRGMRVVNAMDELENAYLTASHEAETAFGNPALYVERFVEQPRHVEIQIMGDSFGNVIHFGERDCSIQRRHQKLLEESRSRSTDSEIPPQLIIRGPYPRSPMSRALSLPIDWRSGRSRACNLSPQAPA